MIYWLLTTSVASWLSSVAFTKSLFGVCAHAVSSCLILALTFVGSLYVWQYSHHRDHPVTIKKRCASVLCVIVWSPVFLYFSLHGRDGPEGGFWLSSFWQLLGFRAEGFVTAALVPQALTMILFAGPLLMRAQDGIFRHYLDRKYWISNFHNFVWIRNQLVAPFSEEFSFRACMLPLLTQCFGSWTSTFVCPLFFGVAHVHHLVDKIRVGCDIERALLETLFQFAYTTVFGVYSAFLFLRTGHLIAPFIVHAFCNHMGFPDFGEIGAYGQPKKSLIMCAFVIGLVSWIVLLMPLTEPRLYGNQVYWPTHGS